MTPIAAPTTKTATTTAATATTARNPSPTLRTLCLRASALASARSSANRRSRARSRSRSRIDMASDATRNLRSRPELARSHGLGPRRRWTRPPASPNMTRNRSGLSIAEEPRWIKGKNRTSTNSPVVTGMPVTRPVASSVAAAHILRSRGRAHILRRRDRIARHRPGQGDHRTSRGRAGPPHHQALPGIAHHQDVARRRGTLRHLRRTRDEQDHDRRATRRCGADLRSAHAGRHRQARRLLTFREGVEKALCDQLPRRSRDVDRRGRSQQDFPVDVLERLADDSRAEVRWTVAMKRKTPGLILERLPRDPEPDRQRALTPLPGGEIGAWRPTRS